MKVAHRHAVVRRIARVARDVELGHAADVQRDVRVAALVIIPANAVIIPEKDVSHPLNLPRDPRGLMSSARHLRLARQKLTSYSSSFLISGAERPGPGTAS